MQEYRTERVKAPVTLRLDDGLEQTGYVFVAPEPQDLTTVAKVQALLNNPGAFFPLELEGEATVVQNKDRMIWCRYEGPIGPVVEITIPRRRVTLILSDDTTLQGDLVADGPPDQRRVLDCLNRADRFVLIESRNGDYLVRKDAITFVPSAELGDPHEEEEEFAVGEPETTTVG